MFKIERLPMIDKGSDVTVLHGSWSFCFQHFNTYNKKYFLFT